MSKARSENAVILTHEHADFDALAAMLGAALLFPGAMPILPHQINRNVRDFVVLYKNQLPFVAPEDKTRTAIERVILVDTHSASLPKGVRKHASYLVIDHHLPRPQESEAHTNHEQWIDAVGATTTLMVERLIEQQIRPTSLQATLLALGIHEDTGSLTYASTTVRDARALAWLLDCGASLAEISHFLHHPLSDGQRQVLEQLITHSETIEVAGHNVVIAQAVAEGFQEEISALAGRLRDFFESDALFLLINLGDIVQMVARSTTDAIDVGGIARTLGGGGHKRAAAAPLHNLTISEVRQRLLDALEQQSRTGITIGQIMSAGRPQMLAPDLPIGEALQLMQRYGHEGFPVVERADDGSERLLGVLTRREADRAANHGLHKEAVRRFMRAGSFTVQPDDPVSLLRRLMVEHNWGQIPVVDASGEIIGIVTRTDLIKLWDTDALPERSAAEMATRMKSSLAATHYHILQLIGKEVAERGHAIYIVGGFVRDLLLSSAPSLSTELSPVEQKETKDFDLDIVIEGDAIEFAFSMQQTFGGRVVAHRQFGTAKWILNDREAPVNFPRLLEALDERDDGKQLPPSLDFVTARTEFYTAPTVLPTVESSNIKLDLHRRDFTINTLALCLNPNRWGVLLDFYGGVSDLQRGLVRVLHSLSFIDDPTRILRAVRYEQRFGFRIEERTLELLHDALSLLERVTPVRIRHEFERIFQETLPERSLQRLAELGVLRQLHPEFAIDDWLENCVVRLRQAIAGDSAVPEWVRQYLSAEPVGRFYWTLLTAPLSSATVQSLEGRLHWDKATQRFISDFQYLISELNQLRDPSLPPSRIVPILEKAELPVLALFSLVYVDDVELTNRIQRYYHQWKNVRPLLNGSHLAALGIARGPLYRQLLEQLRAARLDEKVKSLDEEERFVKDLCMK